MDRRFRKYLPVNQKSVIITGCDTGFGHHLANRLVDHRFTVFAGVLDITGLGSEKLQNRKAPNLHVIQLDITKDNDIEAAVSYVKKILGNETLWGVVNNAGFEIPGDVEICKLSQYKRCIDVNLFGQISIIKAFLPQLRLSNGRIVNMASVRGRFTYPSGSTYHISKYGVETMSDSLRLEMVKFGINVSVIEPGAYAAATSIVSAEMCERVKKECDEMWEAASPEVKETYGKKYIYLHYNRYKKESNNPWNSASSPVPVLDAIEDALLNVQPKTRYLVDGGSGFVDIDAMIARFNGVLPTFISDFILSLITGCYKPVQAQAEST